MTDTTEIEAEAEAAFTVDVARSDSLKKALAIYGQRPIFLIWRMGWCSGKSSGLAQAAGMFTDGVL